PYAVGPGRTMRTTSAPMSASTMAQYGPGPIPAISSSRIPASGPILMFSGAAAREDTRSAAKTEAEIPQIASGFIRLGEKNVCRFHPDGGRGQPAQRGTKDLGECDGGEHGFRGKRPSGDTDLGASRSDRSRPFASRTLSRRDQS